MKEYLVGDKVQYVCNSGYVLVGNSDSLTCSRTLQWLGVDPQCLSIPDFKTYCQSQKKRMAYKLGKYVCSDPKSKI